VEIFTQTIRISNHDGDLDKDHLRMHEQRDRTIADEGRISQGAFRNGLPFYLATNFLIFPTAADREASLTTSSFPKRTILSPNSDTAFSHLASFP